MIISISITIIIVVYNNHNIIINNNNNSHIGPEYVHVISTVAVNPVWMMENECLWVTFNCSSGVLCVIKHL